MLGDNQFFVYPATDSADEQIRAATAGTAARRIEREGR
jgi:hypothetical protein